MVKFILDKKERQAVFQVYKNLSKDELLNRCLLGRTQNPNESLHSKVWHNLRKTKFYRYKTVRLSVTLTISQHNLGYEEAALATELGFGRLSKCSQKIQRKRDSERVKSSTPKGKRKRQKTASDDKDYGAGALN